MSVRVCVRGMSLPPRQRLRSRRYSKTPIRLLRRMREPALAGGASMRSPGAADAPAAYSNKCEKVRPKLPYSLLRINAAIGTLLPRCLWVRGRWGWGVCSGGGGAPLVRRAYSVESFLKVLTRWLRTRRRRYAVDVLVELRPF